ncbi:MAG TPA: SAM-dependent methyltransferase, partial [Candidatus Wallbacteria bacterium]|nr:SAM-dependent methyltransferase [Candidatus Wallbacteria bacterium]
KELYRILKPGGSGILMAPILTDLKENYEDASISTLEDRLKHFGQSDHVRVYSKEGYLKLLAGCGFEVKFYNKEYFGCTIYERSGITDKSVLYIAHKNK